MFVVFRSRASAITYAHSCKSTFSRFDAVNSLDLFDIKVYVLNGMFRESKKAE
jgi:hypothetical protein